MGLCSDIKSDVWRRVSVLMLNVTVSPVSPEGSLLFFLKN